ncbi:polysaccharide biosynthesis/export family protein [Sphingopyxis granuli]|uniref:polysaccharide biosynthesis/export family protein n=1 Tax=Sphingopyxis granuli TaxID=267128 RepID=UPI001FD41474|nr:polysaccharide biosynthesis/export family protein [Sphingopyxis granuli]
MVRTIIKVEDKVSIVAPKFIPLLASLALLGACAGPPPELTGSPTVQVVDQTELPAPTEVDGAPGTAGYRIGAFDRLIVDVFGFEEMKEREIQVDAAGNIALPIAGPVVAGGHTPAEVSEMIERQMRARYVRNPQVSVNLKESVSQYVTVDGQVGQPGNYPMVGDMTLMRSIAAARGAGEFAKLNDVVLFRTVNGQRMVALYDLRAIRRGSYEDPRVYARDLIVVGDSPARRLLRDVIQGSALITTPIVALIQTSN